MLDTCWAALAPGGRIVANAVTLESEHVVVAERAQRGGTLTRIAIAHAEPIGGFTGWRRRCRSVQWAATKS
jgi:precorrin-6Y C5,15-methyltransferase (decarboxylating)